MKTPIKIKTPKPALSALDMKQREELAKMLNSDVFQLALGNALAMKPSPFLTLDTITDANRAMLTANNRLHEVRGWELFSIALFAQAEEPKPPQQRTEETYPTDF